MRIGEVSRRYHISVDNLYYYINYGLLVPPKPRGQYVFDETVLQDLEWILELKELNFTLREIHMLLSLKRISGLADSQDMEELKAVYEASGNSACRKSAENRKLSEDLMKNRGSERKPARPDTADRSPGVYPASFVLPRVRKFPVLKRRGNESPFSLWRRPFPAPAATRPGFRMESL